MATPVLRLPAMPVFDWDAKAANPFQWIVEQAPKVRAERAMTAMFHRERVRATERALARPVR